MLSVSAFWRRHRSKVLYTVGVFGGGYLLYKLFNAHKRRLCETERVLQIEQDNDEYINAQLQTHFECIQKIADTMTLPHAMHYLGDQIAAELDLSHLTERLMMGKGRPSTLLPAEKLELWDKLKILSFTRMLSSLWAMTILSLYIRVQVNILGRQLYLDAAHGLGSSILNEADDPVTSHDQQSFLASADFLADSGLGVLISDMQAATTTVLEQKQLRDLFNTAALHETTMQIVDMFMSMAGPYHWVDYLMPGETRLCEAGSMDDSGPPSDFTRLDQFMVETRAVLLSTEFRDVVGVSLKAAVGAFMEDAESLFGGYLSSGIPLAKLLPRIAQMGPLLLEEASRNRYIQIISDAPEVRSFFTLLYAGLPT